MSFAILFHNKDKTCERVDPEEVNLESLDASNFAWLDFDLSQKQELESVLPKIGVYKIEVEAVLNLAHPYYFRHSQTLILNMLRVCSREGDSIISSPLLIVMSERVIITAHQGASTYIESVLETYEESFKSVGKSPGFIYFLLWDAMVDGFLPQIFYIDEKLEQLDELYLHETNFKGVLDNILKYKHTVRTLKQSLSPMQRSLRHIVNTKLKLVSDEARGYLQGLFEHLDRLAHAIDSLQDRLHSSIGIYNSILSQQINESMKVLAVIATTMMPLSLVAAIYGTNFKYIPEFNWRYGYFFFLGVLFIIGGAMLLVFKKKKWL